MFSRRRLKVTAFSSDTGNDATTEGDQIVRPPRVLGLKISYGTMQPLKATISNNEYDPHYEYLDTANAKK